MTEGPVAEGVKLAGSFVDSLKQQPLSLALVAMNVALLGFFYVILSAVTDQRKREVAAMYQDMKEVREILAKCVVPERRGDLEPLSTPSLFKMPP